MRTWFVCGSRGFPHSATWVPDVLARHGAFGPPDFLMAGGAKGPDTDGEVWARRNGIHVLRVDALWDHYGKPAGQRRNLAMAQVLARLIPVQAFVFWDGTSSGTKRMLDLLIERQIPAAVYYPDGAEWSWDATLGWQRR